MRPEPTPLLTIRAIGMSYALQCHAEDGLDLNTLFLAVSPALGPAVALMESGVSGGMTAILVDRKAGSWDDLLGRILRVFEDQGQGECQWTEDPGAPGQRAVLHRTV
ncbi:MAG TPA: hypothetical protein VFT74_02355 [Isosphaeraceae bacterium]|nr:hypothetical protein [Isosphaeraceae bacterium]